MTNFALGAWIVTLLVGAYLWSYTTGVKRPESTARSSNLPPLVLFVHPLLAIGGLGLWIGWLLSNEIALAWVAVADLAVVIALGSFLGLRTLLARPGHASIQPPRKPRDAPRDPAEVAADRAIAEHQIPTPAIAAHSLLALVTFVSVLIATLAA